VIATPIHPATLAPHSVRPFLELSLNLVCCASLARLRCRSLLLAPSFSPLPSVAHARACSHACTRSLTRAVLSLAHARCALARAFSRCCSREFWEAQLSYGTKRASERLSLAHACCSRLFRSMLPLSHTHALSVVLALSLAHARCALAHSRTLHSHSLTCAVLSLAGVCCATRYVILSFHHNAIVSAYATYRV